MPMAIEDWDKKYKAGHDYSRVAHGAGKRPNVFTPSMIRNICAMGIESYFMAIFMYRGILPRNHTMQDLLEDAAKLFPIDPELENLMLKIDSQMQLCSLENFRIDEAAETDVPGFLKALDMTASIAAEELGGAEQS